jgi:hypothetical protein
VTWRTYDVRAPGRVACVSILALSAVPTGLNSSIGRSQRCVSARSLMTNAALPHYLQTIMRYLT